MLQLHGCAPLPRGPQNTPDKLRGGSAILPVLPKQLLPKPRPVSFIWLFGGVKGTCDGHACDDPAPFAGVGPP